MKKCKRPVGEWLKLLGKMVEIREDHRGATHKGWQIGRGNTIILVIREKKA